MQDRQVLSQWLQLKVWSGIFVFSACTLKFLGGVQYVQYYSHPLYPWFICHGLASWDSEVLGSWVLCQTVLVLDGYKFSKSQEKINHLMYMDNIKLFAKSEKELETQIHTVRIYSQDMGMEFGWEKCAMLLMKSGKRHPTDGIVLPNQDKIRMLRENKTYKYLGILEVDTKQVEMKEKIKKGYLRRTRKLLEAKLCSRNLIKRNKYLGCTPY